MARDDLARTIGDAEAGVQSAIAIMATQPLLDYDDLFYWKAFQELGTERPIKPMGGVASIPFKAIHWYAYDYIGLPEDEADDFIQAIRTVDNRFMVLATEKMDKLSKQTN